MVNREFARTEPDRLWLTDITEHPTREGQVYCAVVFDASHDASQTANHAVNALGIAVENRRAAGAT